MLEERRLAGILVGDVVGFSAAVGRDEVGTLAQLFEIQSQVIEPTIAEAGGRVVKTTGDGFLADFPSVAGGVGAAVAIQRALGDRPAVGPPMVMRMGFHLADVVTRDGDIFGDGVNVAARLEQAAEPGGLLISDAARRALVGGLVGEFEAAGRLELKNIARPVAAWRWTGSPGVPTRPGGARSRPKIAVLPFEDLSGTDQAHWAAGIVEDLTTSLSRFHWFRVTARASTAAVAAETSDVGELARRLGARYLVFGSVRVSGDRMRVAAQLVDADSGDLVWSDRFDGGLGSLFAVQDDVVKAIAGALVPGLVSSFRPRSRATLSSWETAMRGWSLAFDIERGDLVEAIAQFEASLGDDPSNGLALCGLAFAYSNPYYQAGIERDPERALAAARAAIDLDERDAFAWCLAGVAHAHAGAFDAAERELRQALIRNPNLALAHGYMAVVAGFRLDVAAAERWWTSMEDLSPADPMLGSAEAVLSLARFGTGDYRGALEMAERGIARAPSSPPSWRIKAASLEVLGRHDEAAAAVEHLLALGPIDMAWVRRELTPLSDPVAWDAYLDALRRAGVPVG